MTDLQQVTFDTLYNMILDEISGGQPELLTGGQRHMLNQATQILVNYIRMALLVSRDSMEEDMPPDRTGTH